MFRQVVNKALRLSHVTSEQLCSFSTTSLKNKRSDLNLIQLTGNVGQQPKLKEKGYISFLLANHNVYRDKTDELISKTSWINIIVSRPGLKDQAMNNINKGDMLYVSGKLKTTSYQDEETQRYINTSYVVADEIITIRSRGVQNTNTAEPEEQGEELHEEEDNLPEESVENK